MLRVYRSCVFTAAMLALMSTAVPAQTVSDDAVREKAISWLKFNNKFGADSDFVRDMTEVIDESLSDDMNVNFFFGPNLMDSGKYMTMHIYCGTVLSFEMTQAHADAMELGPSSATVTTSGGMGKRLTNASFELSELQLVESAIDGQSKFRGKVYCRAKQAADGSYALRVGYRANQGVGQFQWLDTAPTTTGTMLEFEFGPINDEDDQDSPFRGPVAIFFDLVSVDESSGDIEVIIHSNTVGQILLVK